jgi:hypothetical protein
MAHDYTTDSDAHEKMRQAVMRYRELLDLMTAHMAEGEHAYAALFAPLPDEVREGWPEKAQQGEAARLLLDDAEPLRRAVLTLRFNAREMEKEFEALYDRLSE